MTSRNLRLAVEFDAAFARRSSELALRPERADDGGFLKALFVACSSLVGLVPPTMIDFQAETQRSSHNRAYPDAMHRVVEADGAPVGRAMIDWRTDRAHLVDIAVLPEARPTRAGRMLLLAWLEVADAAGLRATLEVLLTNPALEIYRKLGFGEVPEQMPDDPVLTMERYPVKHS